MLQIQGRSDLFLILEIIKKIILIIPIVVGIMVGIMPMLYVNLVVGIIGYFLNSHWSGRLLGYSSWMQIKDIAPSYGLAILVAIVVWFFKYLPISDWIILPIQIVTDVIVFVTICKLTKMEEYDETKHLLVPFYYKLFQKREVG
jgi:hypothetical protein